MTDPYRTACEQTRWDVELRCRLPLGMPFSHYVHHTTVLARDETEAVQKATAGRGCDYEVVRCEPMPKRSTAK